MRIERVRALLKASGAAELGQEMSEAMVSAEAPASGNKRIDLLIEWQDSSGQHYAAAIEAKLGHHITSGQLPPTAIIFGRSRGSADCWWSSRRG